MKSAFLVLACALLSSPPATVYATDPDSDTVGARDDLRRLSHHRQKGACRE